MVIVPLLVVSVYWACTAAGSASNSSNGSSFRGVFIIGLLYFNTLLGKHNKSLASPVFALPASHGGQGGQGVGNNPLLKKPSLSRDCHYPHLFKCELKFLCLRTSDESPPATPDRLPARRATMLAS